MSNLLKGDFGLMPFEDVACIHLKKSVFNETGHVWEIVAISKTLKIAALIDFADNVEHAKKLLKAHSASFAMYLADATK